MAGSWSEDGDLLVALQVLRLGVRGRAVLTGQSTGHVEGCVNWTVYWSDGALCSLGSLLVRWRAVLTGQTIGQMERCVNWTVYWSEGGLC